MTEPFRPDDDLVNAVLDGEATPDERARVLSDPDLRDRLDELTRVRDLIAAAVPPPDEATRDDNIRRAIAAGRRDGDERVVALRSRRPGVPTWLAAAAVIVLLLAGGALLASVDGGDDDAASLSSGDESSGAGTEESAADAAEDAGGAATSDTVRADELARDLGVVADDDELRESLRLALDGDLDAFEDDEVEPPTDETLSTLPGEARACGEQATAAARPGPRRLFVATYDGAPAIVYVYGPDSDLRVVVVRADDCTLLSEFPA
jgi:hypothetical protein